jgi:hypothetical protein
MPHSCTKASYVRVINKQKAFRRVAEAKTESEMRLCYSWISKLVPQPQLLVAPGIPVILN